MRAPWVFLAGMVVGCGGATEPSPGLTGSYELLETVSTWYLGLNLEVTGSSITGTGLYSVFFGPVVVTGTYTPPDVHLVIVRSPLSASTGTNWREFRGRFEAGGLTGRLEPWTPAGKVNDGPEIVLARTDGAPTGTATMTLEENGTTRTSELFAWFTHFPNFLGDQQVVWLAIGSGDRPVPLTGVGFAAAWDGLTQPGPGSYTLAGAGPRLRQLSVGEVPEGGGAGRSFEVEEARIDIEVSKRFVLMGRVDIRATVAGSGEAVRITGRFGAGCQGTLC